MPQMSPMSWTFIFFLLVMFMVLTISSMNSLAPKAFNKQIVSKKENNMKW